MTHFFKVFKHFYYNCVPLQLLLQLCKFSYSHMYVLLHLYEN